MINRDAETDGARSCGGDEPILSLSTFFVLLSPRVPEEDWSGIRDVRMIPVVQSYLVLPVNIIYYRVWK